MPSHSLPSLRALAFVTKAHKGQKRTSGEPFVTHLTAVADNLRQINADEETITAALLHDVLEDTPVTAARLKKEFGPVVTNLVQGVTKVQALEKTFDKTTRNMESIRKMFRMMGKDIRALFIKLADRLHNMQTLHYVPVEKQLRIAQETEDIYCPLANLLGLRDWYEKLSDLCFSVLDPVEAEFIQRKYSQTWKQQHKGLEQWTAHLQSFLAKHGVKTVDVRLRRRHAREVRQLAVEREEILQHAESFHSVQIVLKNDANPYTTLGAVHAFASPVPGMIEDYVATPKVNGYEAIHTVVVTSASVPITVIVQTEEMNARARLGMAILYQQPAALWRKSVPDWLEALQTLDESEHDLHAFFRRVRSEIFAERSHVQCLVGRTKKAIDLPASASALDLAYYAGAETGAIATAAKINNRYVSLKELIHDGDVVEIMTDRRGNVRAPQDLYVIRTALAHKHLVAQLSSLPEKERTKRGTQLLQNALRFTMDPFFSIRWQKEVERAVKGGGNVLANIGSGTIDAFLHVEEHSRPEQFFLLDPHCFRFSPGMRPGTVMRYVLRGTIEDLRSGQIVGVQVGPDVIEVISSADVRESRWKVFSREIVPLQIDPAHVDFPFFFALKWNFEPDTNPLKDIAVLESFLDTPVHLLQFASTSITLGFRTDRLRTLQIGYKFLYGLPHVTELFRISHE